MFLAGGSMKRAIIRVALTSLLCWVSTNLYAEGGTCAQEISCTLSENLENQQVICPDLPNWRGKSYLRQASDQTYYLNFLRAYVSKSKNEAFCIYVSAHPGLENVRMDAPTGSVYKPDLTSSNWNDSTENDAPGSVCLNPPCSIVLDAS